MTDRPKDPNELGALWRKKGAKGWFLSGTINGQDVICFPIPGGEDEGTRLPAWRVLKSDPRRVRQPEPVDPGPNDPFA